jgi:hypothetical protein
MFLAIFDQKVNSFASYCFLERTYNGTRNGEAVKKMQQTPAITIEIQRLLN